MARTYLIPAVRQTIKQSPMEIFDWYLFFYNAVISFSGVAKAFDEGWQNHIRSTANSSLAAVYVSRSISEFWIGDSTIVPSAYLAEV